MKIVIIAKRLSVCMEDVDMELGPSKEKGFLIYEHGSREYSLQEEGKLANYESGPSKTRVNYW